MKDESSLARVRRPGHITHPVLVSVLRKRGREGGGEGGVSREARKKS